MELGFRTRLLLVFAAGFLALFLVGAYGVFTYRQVLTKADEEQQKAASQLRLAKEIELYYAQQNLAWGNLLLRGQDPAQYHNYLAAFYENERQTLDRAERLHDELEGHAELQGLTRHFVQGLHQLRTQYREALRIYNASKQSQHATDQFLSAITRKPSEMLQEVESLLIEHHADTLQEVRLAARKQEVNIALVSVAVLAALLLFVLWFVDANFAKPMAHAIQTARHVASGNLNERIQAFRGGEFGAFARAFNVMLERLAETNANLEATVANLRAEISHREQVEQALRLQQQALELANRELETFSYTVSHDLRAPLRAIDGFSQVLGQDYAERLDAEGRRYLDQVRRGARRMGVLIEELLGLSRVSQTALKPGIVDLGAMAREIAADLAAAEPGRKVAVEIGPRLLAWGDAALLHAAISNLLSNAWKYTRRTHAARIEFKSSAVREGAAFYVRDNGAGFDMEHAEHLFRPFQRLHSESEFEGTGVGLATVERIIRRHGGRVWAEAAPGRGATFWFRLPAGPRNGTSESAAENASA